MVTPFSFHLNPVSFLGELGKLRKGTNGFVMSVRPHATTQLPQVGFS